jgi:Mn2+/Fe2+ NRAMP family transporter
MVVFIIIVLAIICALVAVVGFVLYGHYRMKEDEEKEKIFLHLHYAALSVLLLLGIIYMFFMVETAP